MSEPTNAPVLDLDAIDMIHGGTTSPHRRAVTALVAENRRLRSAAGMDAFAEKLPDTIGFNLIHWKMDRQHVTGRDCPCRPSRVAHIEATS